ncbi:hypothetical protein H9P43_006915 [Blastocladiella emersonii ATCC 22665]|nr:hypothetical protein H9P43_006915 [Blastocladiella emersonii ATCC 22665]
MGDFTLIPALIDNSKHPNVPFPVVIFVRSSRVTSSTGGGYWPRPGSRLHITGMITRVLDTEAKQLHPGAQFFMASANISAAVLDAHMERGGSVDDHLRRPASRFTPRSRLASDSRAFSSSSSSITSPTYSSSGSSRIDQPTASNTFLASAPAPFHGDGFTREQFSEYSLHKQRAELGLDSHHLVPAPPALAQGVRQATRRHLPPRENVVFNGSNDAQDDDEEEDDLLFSSIKLATEVCHQDDSANDDLDSEVDAEPKKTRVSSKKRKVSSSASATSSAPVPVLAPAPVPLAGK